MKRHQIIVWAALLLVGCKPVKPPVPPVVPVDPPVVVVPPVVVPPAVVVPDVRVDGDVFRAGDALFVPRFVSGLTLLARTPEQQTAYLKWASDTGFNGVRVFAGALAWAGQTPESARAALPGLLDRAAALGLVVEVTALTDTGTGYAAKAHLRGVVDILRGRHGVLLELANELGHSTQSPDITPDRMRSWGRELVPNGLPWALGAVGTDEVCPADGPDRPESCAGVAEGQYPAAGGSYVTVHLDRGRDRWNRPRRVRELLEVRSAHGPTFNNEPIGCAEPGTPGQRSNDPAEFAVYGALDRAFTLGGVHHSQAGLMAEIPGPVQQRCAEAYVAAWKAVDGILQGAEGEYKNAGHGGSPLTRDVDWTRVVRAYSFVHGDRAAVMLVGTEAGVDLPWQNEFRLVSEVYRIQAADGRFLVVLSAAR